MFDQLILLVTEWELCQSPGPAITIALAGWVHPLPVPGNGAAKAQPHPAACGRIYKNQLADLIKLSLMKLTAKSQLSSEPTHEYLFILHYNFFIAVLCKL
jgi:hypothetical protein